MAKSNFAAAMPTQTTQVERRGLPYFLYGQQLKAQTRQLGVQVANSIDHNTTGIHEKDMEYLGGKIQESRDSKDGFVDKILDGNDVTNQDVRSIADTFRKSKYINKELEHARLNAGRLQKAKDLTFNAGLARGDMKYYDKWYNDSVDQWGGSFGPDGSPRAFELADVPDYVDIVKEFTDEMKIATKHMTSDQRAAAMSNIEEIYRPDNRGGMQTFYRISKRGQKTGDNYDAIEGVINRYNEAMEDPDSREGRFMNYMTDDGADNTYSKDISRKIFDLGETYKDEQETEATSALVKGDYDDGSGTITPRTTYLGAGATNKLVHPKEVNTNPVYKDFNYKGIQELGGVQYKDVYGDYKPTLTPNLAITGVTEKRMTDLFDAHRESSYRVLNAVSGGDTSLQAISKSLDVLAQEGNKEAQEAQKYISKLQDRGMDDVMFTNDDYAGKVYDEKNSNIFGGSTYPEGENFDYKETLMNKLSKVLETSRENTVIPDTRIVVDVPIKEAEQKVFYKELSTLAFDADLTAIEMDEEGNAFSAVSGTNFDTGEGKIKGDKVSGTQLSEGIRQALLYQSDGRNDYTPDGFKMLPGITVADSNNSALSFLNQEVVAGMTAQEKAMYDNAIIYNVGYKDSADNEHTLQVVSTNASSKFRQPQANTEMSPMLVEDKNSRTGFTTTNIRAAVHDLDNGETVELHTPYNNLPAGSTPAKVTKIGTNRYQITTQRGDILKFNGKTLTGNITELSQGLDILAKENMEGLAYIKEREETLE